jgi:hypothetical protein
MGEPRIPLLGVAAPGQPPAGGDTTTPAVRFRAAIYGGEDFEKFSPKWWA